MKYLTVAILFAVYFATLVIIALGLWLYGVWQGAKDFKRKWKH